MAVQLDSDIGRPFGSAPAAAIRGERAYSLEHRVIRPDGAVRWVHETAQVECDAAGQPVRMVGVVQDITERRHLEERLRQAQKMEAVGQLAGGVAHDFNNILTAVLLQLSVLQEDPRLGADAHDVLREVVKGARRAADLTRQLLLFSRRSAMQVKRVNLNDLLADLQGMLPRLLGEHITFETALEPVLPSVNADPGMIQQVVVNLCVCLPAAVAPAAAEQKAAPARSVPSGHETILLVEDDRAVRKVIAALFRRWGYRVLEAGDGREALGVWQEHGDSIDLLFTDAVMPGGLTGLDLVGRLRAVRPGLKAILSSGYSSQLTQPDLEAAHGVTFVPKPCSPEDLAAAVRKCLGETAR